MQSGAAPIHWRRPAAFFYRATFAAPRARSARRLPRARLDDAAIVLDLRCIAQRCEVLLHALLPHALNHLVTLLLLLLLERGADPRTRCVCRRGARSRRSAP